MELKDTIELMNSSDYKERFKAEYLQVKIRYDKLHKMLVKWDAGTLGFTPTCAKAAFAGAETVYGRIYPLLAGKSRSRRH